MVSKRLNLSTVEEARAYIYKSKMLLNPSNTTIKEKKFVIVVQDKRSRTAFKTGLGRHEKC
jgi:hypothetical protein